MTHFSMVYSYKNKT